ncbi:MAG TPA: hypothetical protein VGL49_04730, partial [Acidimicrobiales bacterium]
MADPWTPPPGDERAPTPIPRHVERYAMQSSLADLARTGADDPAHTPEAKPGLAGHQALAALAAEVAQAAAVQDHDTERDQGAESTGQHRPA